MGGTKMRHDKDLSTYTPQEFKDMSKQVLKDYRKDQPDKKFILDSPFPWFVRVSNEAVQLCIQIKDKDNWVRQHEIRL
jgi:hypothetical protein